MRETEAKVFFRISASEKTLPKCSSRKQKYFLFFGRGQASSIMMKDDKISRR